NAGDRSQESGTSEHDRLLAPGSWLLFLCSLKFSTVVLHAAWPCATWASAPCVVRSAESRWPHLTRRRQTAMKIEGRKDRPSQQRSNPPTVKTFSVLPFPPVPKK